MPRPPDMTFQRLKELVAQNAPALYMHPRDSFMPCSVEWFMDNSELWLIENHEESSGRRLLRQGEITGTSLSKHEREFGGANLQLRLNEDAKPGPPVEEIDRTPLYANAKWVVRKDGSPEAIEITYLTFYAHNGYYDIGYLGLLKVGAHDGDWEHLTVRLDASTGALQGVYCNAHRSRDGCWISADQVERTLEGRLKIYVARHGHGTYPQAGIWWRAGLMANDLTSDKGAVWKATTVYILPQLDSIVEAADKLPAELSNQAGSAISILATEMEASADHAPFCNQLQRKGPESKEVNVLQVFIDTESVFSGGQGRLPNQLPGVSASDASGNVSASQHRISSVVQDEEIVSLVEAPSRGSKLPAPISRPSNYTGSKIQVLQHSGEWLKYLGQWGTTPSPAAQGWFWTAEPPVSRGTLLRIIGHPWPETESLL